MAKHDPTTKEIESLRRQALGHPYGPVRIAFLEEAVRLADLSQDTDRGYQLRGQLVEAAAFGGAPEKLLVAFSWRLAHADRHPERYPDSALMWEYKWVLNRLVDFPQITRQQIEDMTEDMIGRYRRHGLGLRPIWKIRYFTAFDMGDVEAARSFRRKWQRTPAGKGNDCAACEVNSEVRYQVHSRRYRVALEKARPLLEGRLQCSMVPRATFARVLLPLLHLDRLKEAGEYHLRAYPQVADNPTFLSEQGQHLEFLALTGNFTRALGLVEKHLPFALQTRASADRFDFVRPALVLFERLRAKGPPTVSLRLPESLSSLEEGGTYPVAALRDWCAEDCRDIARQFDRRNGNNANARRVEEARETVGLGREFLL